MSCFDFCLRRSVRLMAAGIALVLGVSPIAGQAQAAMCGNRDMVVEQLTAVHGEARISVGLQRNSQIMETYANADTGSWTIIVTTPAGMACLVAAGEAFQADLKDAQNTQNDDPA